jgi:hypothetical protein
MSLLKETFFVLPDLDHILETVMEVLHQFFRIDLQNYRYIVIRSCLWLLVVINVDNFHNL